MPWLVALLGYLLGSIPTAYVAGRILRGQDIRRMGDGNVGAGNAFHQLGAKVGVIIFLLDVIKGVLAVTLAKAANLSQAFVLITGTAAVIGHNWPIFIGFRGGRGESTAMGVLVALVTVPVLILIMPTVAALFVWKSVIKASCVFFIPLPLLCWWAGVSGELIVYSIALASLVGFTHFLRTRPKARQA